MAKTFKALLSETTDDLRALVRSYTSLYKLQALEKGVPAAVRGIYTALMALVGVTVLIFLLLTAAFAFGLIFAQGEPYVVLRVLTLGFLCTVGVLLLILLLLLGIRSKVCESITAKIINRELDELEEKEKAEAALHATDVSEETSGYDTHVDTDTVQLD